MTAVKKPAAKRSTTRKTAPATVPVRKTRGPGRPAAKADAQARERILDAALNVFARNSVAATQTKAIAVEAGVTPALVHYYFPDRESLLDAVADERIAPLVAAAFGPVAQTTASAAKTGRPSQADTPPGTLLADIAERLIRMALATPWFPGLWIREIVSAEGLLRERVLGRGGLLRAGGVASAIARARGAIHPDLEPAWLLVSMVGLSMLPLAARHIWERLPGAPELEADALVRHVRTLLEQGLLTPTQPTTSPAGTSRKRASRPSFPRAGGKPPS